MKGILLAGGRGTRLGPLTVATSKQLLPVFDKPLLFYPLSTLMLVGVRDVLIIGRKMDLASMRTLLGDGGDLGIRLTYAHQEEPNGIAEALTIGESFLEGQSCCLALGDNLFHGSGLGRSLAELSDETLGTILAYPVKDPRPYAVVSFDEAGRVTDLEEKPTEPKSTYAVPGLYFLPGDAPEIAGRIARSSRGELEITDVNRELMAAGRLHVRVLPRGTIWIDAGTPESLLEAAYYVRTIAQRQGRSVCCPEEVAWRNGWIDTTQLEARGRRFSGSTYGDYLLSLAQ